MLDPLLSSHLPDLHVDEIHQTETLIEVSMADTASTAVCPLCGQPSRHVHSRYRRQVTDLTWSGHPVRLQLHVRRFFCANLACSRRIYCERLAARIAPHDRCTRRLMEVQRQVALESGGEGGSRVLATVAFPRSGATLLRGIRQHRILITAPRVLGVDDYALRKGRRYGTLLVALETHRPVDLWPDRSAASLERWLREHPGVEVISRDRAAEYAEGASRGAPRAVQVADRFHLLHNVVDVLQRLLERHQSALREAGSGRRESSPPPPTAAVSPPTPTNKRGGHASRLSKSCRPTG